MEAERRCEFLQKYAWLSGMYQIDFFVDKLWEQMPQSWQMAFQNISLADLYGLLDSKNNWKALQKRKDFPLSFIEFCDSVDRLSISRDLANFHEFFGQWSFQNKTEVPSKNPDNSLLWRKVKRKKRHEIEQLCHLIGVLRSNLPLNSSFDHLIDIGAGLGHFSRILASRCASDRPLTVTTIEANETLVIQSAKLDQKCSPVCLNPHRTWKHLRMGERLTTGDEALGTCILGLHACGDLSPTIISQFLQEKSIKVLISIGCCYHKLNGGGRDKKYYQEWTRGTASDDASHSLGFPLSQAYKNCKLSYAARELACHAREQFVANLRDYSKNSDAAECETIPANFRIQTFRAILEWLIISRYPTERHRGLESSSATDFWQFAKQALSKAPELNDVLELVGHGQSVLKGFLQENDRETRRQNDEMLTPDAGRRMFVLYCLRMLMAPVIESAILDDRRCFLKENQKTNDNSITVAIVPVFDSLISARNLALVAWKED